MKFFATQHGQVILGDCLEVLPTLPRESVHCCVTSPPYWNLRNYNTSKQLGLESTLNGYITNLVRVSRRVRRVLRDDGSFWLNIGDSFQSKQLQGIPWKVAFALQEDGWYLRQEIIWSKPNPMPSSITDRPSTSHEQIFLLTKRSSYFYDAEAIKEKSVSDWKGKDFLPISRKDKTALSATSATDASMNNRTEIIQSSRNKRSVWTVSVASYKESHFAVFPPKLIEPCILAGSSAKGCCPKCGSPWKRKLEKNRVATRPGKDGKVGRLRKSVMAVGGVGDTSILTGNRDPLRHVTETKTIGWEPTCDCNAGDPVPCTVLDCFSGSGTSGYVAIKHGRKYIGIELNPEYVKLSMKRLRKGELKKDFTGLVFPA